MPDSLDVALLVDHLRALKAGHDVAVPAYDFTTYTRSGRFEVVVPRPFVIIEGILLFAFAEIRDELDFLIFREGSEEVRAERRRRRDVVERGRTPESVWRQWRETVQPMFEVHVGPYAHYADVIIGPDVELDTVVGDLTIRLETEAGLASS